MRVERYPGFDLYISDEGTVMMFNHEGVSGRKNFGRPVKKASRAGRKADGKLRSAGLNNCGHRSNPRPKR